MLSTKFSTSTQPQNIIPSQTDILPENNEWHNFIKGLYLFSDDFMETGRESHTTDVTREIF